MVSMQYVLYFCSVYKTQAESTWEQAGQRMLIIPPLSGSTYRQVIAVTDDEFDFHRMLCGMTHRLFISILQSSLECPYQFVGISNVPVVLAAFRLQINSVFLASLLAVNILFDGYK